MVFTPIWYNDLQAASWRGVPFIVESIGTKAGRRVAVHEYPFRDTPWVEDLGKGLEEFTVVGFVQGDDVKSKFESIKRACEQSGPGEFVHPRLGSKTVSLVASGFSEAKESGSNVVGFSLVFLVTQEESSTSLWPVAKTSTLSAITDAVLNTNGAASGSFLDGVKDIVGDGLAAVQSVRETAQGYVDAVQRTVGDARQALGAVQGFATALGVPSGAFGRFNRIINSAQGAVTEVSSGLAMVQRTENGVSHALEGATRLRDTVTRAGSTVSNLVGSL
ncbi:DNA circularization N-terminal domain-containing protein [Paracraurococcus lichenis]|uniref:DNA circularization N-terminal domain-containing protein n=1 Tax=Paracraurococcus lichenis TaxID=3064888 RepID=A0ABT9E4G8_9PROT|nr:DNA circularization N-terminal domain-containing protein [Paracraurococcus sp. LOR1-02]MDO9711048.1 DNA circularization N-terminal domain-containing protein [Paracraurococcus sp. LOR1-02]